MSFGLYIPRQSLIHAVSAQVKGLVLAIAGIVVFLVSDPVWLAGMLAIVSILPVLARLPLNAVGVQLRPVLPLLVAIWLLQGLLGDWVSGWLALLRFMILVILATIVTLTTRLSDMVEAIEQVLQPLQIIGVNSSQVSLILAMAIRFVPVLLEQFHEIQEAQRARGLDRHWIALLVPLMVKTLRMADELSDALDARCYDAEP